MHAAVSHTKVQEVLIALEEVLAEETQALIHLDPTTVETASRRKFTLTQTLAAIDQPFTREEQLQLTRVRTKLRNNLVLLAHAREHVQVAVQTAQGRPLTLPFNSQPMSAAARLDLRG
jgi:flagellar biosynthesis/type III secretory pathway chaperone